MKNNKNFVIGLGEIGKAIKQILKCEGVDIEKIKKKHYNTIHICFPYSENFVKNVRTYQKYFTPKLTIIHSTVPIGTSKKLNAVHSPVRGKHPNLAEGVKTFVKYFGGQKSREASKIFAEIGIPISDGHTSDTTEALKIWDTTQYGLNIVLQKEIAKFCEENNLDFSIIYTLANKTYNEGYEKLGNPEYKKYILKNTNGKIGGHCVINNLAFLDSKISKFILDYNKGL